MQKNPYSTWITNKKVIQKVNWVDKLETPFSKKSEISY